MPTQVNRRVNVHSKLTVVSSRPIGPGKTDPFTALDHAMGLHTLHVVFYYRTNPFFDSDLTNLRVSLAELLCLYPRVTGRLARGKDGNWVVKCNDAGVRMLRAKVKTTLDEWLRSADECEERDLTVWEGMPDDPSIWSPFYIQMNDFEGGGLAIGLSCTHMHADPTSVTMLLKSWTELHRGHPISHPPIFHLPPLHLHDKSSPNTNSKYYATKSKAEAPAVKMATITFRFSNSVIKQCLSKAHDKCPNATPFDVLAALFWTRIARLKSPPHNNQTQTLSICIDFRTLKPAPVPFGYFGNAFHFSQLSLDSEVVNNGGLGEVVGIVHHHAAGLKEEEFWSDIDWFENRKGETGKYAPPFRMYGPELTCVSLEFEHMNYTCQKPLMYEAMFEDDEKPVHVSYRVGNVEGEGLIVVMPSSSSEEGLGRTVMVTLPEEQIDGLRADPAILDLKPTVLINGRT
ncbi:hypothetical protein ACSBR2_017881 [Camellia fascicularis]